MKIAIMQPYFFPYIGYFQLINCVDKFVIYDDVNFIKGGWINRNNILLNGEKSFLNIQMIGSSSYKKINEIKIHESKIKIINKIENAYSKAPFFSDILPLLNKIILYNSEELSSYLINSILLISEYLEINTEFLVSSEIEKDNNLKGQDKVIDICKRLNASVYVNAIGGMDLYCNDDFLKKNINLKFIDTKNIYYKQFNEKFTPNLSIVDVLMFNNKEKIIKLLNNYTII